MNQRYEYQLGQRLRALRETKKLTQEQLSAQLQTRGCYITRSALAKMEVGQRHIYPDELFLQKMMLQVEFDDLFPMMDE